MVGQRIHIFDSLPNKSQVWKLAMENNQNLTGLLSWYYNQNNADEDVDDVTICIREYMENSEAFHAATSFKEFCTIKHPEWYEAYKCYD